MRIERPSDDSRLLFGASGGKGGEYNSVFQSLDCLKTLCTQRMRRKSNQIPKMEPGAWTGRLRAGLGAIGKMIFPDGYKSTELFEIPLMLPSAAQRPSYSPGSTLCGRGSHGGGQY